MVELNGSGSETGRENDHISVMSRACVVHEAEAVAHHRLPVAGTGSL
jgi:hypothetical protein